MKPHIAIIGAGVMGVTLAYHLSEYGYRVTIYERAGAPGGLASALTYDGTRIDRYYHTILSSDLSMQGLIAATGLRDKLHFTATKQGFYHEGALYPFNTMVDFLTFPPLNLFQRIRFGLQIVAAMLERSAGKMDRTPVEEWLLRVSGRGVVETIWKPLLRAKFDSETSDVPATYIWSRLRRMLATRQGVTSKEMMCYLEGGYYTLIAALLERCAANGVSLHLNTPVTEIIVRDGRAYGVKVNDTIHEHDAVISTLPSPLLARLLPDAPSQFCAVLSAQDYLRVLCPLLILKRRLTPYYVLNITDSSVPFTAVVETTNLIAPEHVGGHHLVYLPKYLSPQSDLAAWSDDRVQHEWMAHFRRMFPAFDPDDLVAFLVQHARYVEPLRPIGTTGQIPHIETPVERLYMCNTVMVYPELNNGESVTLLAGEVSDLVRTQITGRSQPALASQ